MTKAPELRAYYYRTKGRSELDVHHAGPDGRPAKVVTTIVADKREARTIAQAQGATPWNF